MVSWWVRRCRPLWPLACLNSGDCTAEVLDEGADQARILEEYEFAGKCGVTGSPGCRLLCLRLGLPGLSQFSGSGVPVKVPSPGEGSGRAVGAVPLSLPIWFPQG